MVYKSDYKIRQTSNGVNDLKKMPKKDLIVFDLDGTLIETKSPLDSEMSKLLKELLMRKKVAVIGGGKYEVFKSLFLERLRCEKSLLKNLFIFPTTSTSFYKYQGRGWKNVYSLRLSKGQIKKIKDTFEKVFKEIGYQHPKKTYGEVIEDRGTQVSFSVYGQDLVTALGGKGVKMKKEWKKKHTKTKMKIAMLMQKYLPEFEVRAAGYTTIDVTKKGIDKAYGLKQTRKYLKVPFSKMLFVGDALYKGGNDYAVIKTGVDYISVVGPNETKRIISELIKN